MLICPQCGKKESQGIGKLDSFCWSCGGALENRPLPVCTKGHVAKSLYDQYCTTCGEKLFPRVAEKTKP